MLMTDQTGKETTMSATKAITTNLTLTQAVSEAAMLAIKNGMGSEEVVAVLQKIAELIENADAE